MTNKQKAIAAIAAAGIVVALFSGHKYLKPEKHILIATWNVRGYPETEQPRRDWFHEKLTEISSDIICVQEIANQDRVDKFLANETKTHRRQLYSSIAAVWYTMSLGRPP